MDYRKALSLMLASRYAEEGVEELASKGLIWGTYHLSTGQEACHIGVSMALEDGDIVVPTHRCHGYNIGQGSSLCSFFSEMLGSRHGLCGGLGGSMHMTDMAHGNFGSSAVVGSGISIAGGIALSFARRGLDNIAVAVLGDGAFHAQIALLQGAGTYVQGLVGAVEHIDGLKLFRTSFLFQGGQIQKVSSEKEIQKFKLKIS